MGAGFFFGKTCRLWWRSAPHDVSDMKKLCMEVPLVLQVPFIWDFIFTVLHMQYAHTHIPFQKLATALAIGISSEGVLKYERLKQKKKKDLSECLVQWVFFFCIEQHILLLMKGEEKLEYMRWQGSSV